jgi:hypothetical protein
VSVVSEMTDDKNDTRFLHRAECVAVKKEHKKTRENENACSLQKVGVMDRPMTELGFLPAGTVEFLCGAKKCVAVKKLEGKIPDSQK